MNSFKDKFQSLNFTLLVLNFVPVLILTFITCFSVNVACDSIVSMYSKASYDSALTYKKELCKNQVQIAIQIINSEHDNVKKGEKSLIQAKEDAKKAISNLRYGDNNSNYYWIDDITGLCVLYPPNPSLEGTNRLKDVDNNGVEIMKKIQNVAYSKDSCGYVEYNLLNTKTNSYSPKICYSQYLTDWNWIISTSLDIKEEQENFNKTFDALYKKVKIITAIVYSVATLFLIISAVITIRSTLGITKKLNIIKDMATTMETGDLRNRQVFSSLNELDSTGNALNKAQDQIVALISEINRLSLNFGNALNSFKDTFEGMNYSIQAVSSSIEEITESANKQAISTADSSNNIKTIADNISNTTKEINQLELNSQNMNSFSKASMSSLAELLSINNKTKLDIEKMYNQTSTNSTSVKKINNAANLINQIAEDTNLLSLNASIEAARAGENGKGFAVVATEIGALAIKSSETVNEINTLLQELQQNSTDSLEIMEHIHKSSNEQNEKLENTINLFKNLSETLDLCFNSINSINKKIDTIDKNSNKLTSSISALGDIASNNAASTEETTATVTTLTEMVANTSSIIESLSNDFDNLSSQINAFKY